jgi:hypothetical protein
MFFQALERYEDCLALHERAYKGYLAVLGSDHLTTRGRLMYYECMQETVGIERAKMQKEKSAELERAKTGKSAEIESADVEANVDITSTVSDTTIVNTRRFNARRWKAAKESVREFVSRKRNV